MTLEEQEEERFDWVHPSWRDVIIEHLMRRPNERRRFLQHCGVAGLELALSISGGRSGERELPLLQTDDDWLTFGRRSIQLIHEMTIDEHQGLMSATRSLLQSAQAGSDRESQAVTLAREILPAIVAEWDSRTSVLTTGALQHFYTLSEMVLPLSGGPQLAQTLRTQLGPLQGDNYPDLVNDTLDWEALDLALLVKRNEPRALRQTGWPQEHSEYLRQLAARARNVLARARRLIRAIDKKQRVTVDAAQQLSYETFSQYRIVSLLRQLDRRVDRNRYLERGLSRAERQIDVWLEKMEEDAREERVQHKKDDEDDGANDDASSSRDVAISEIFSDL
jgi:hypothetical protein